MGFFDFILTGVGLSMDACAVSAAHGLSMSRICWKRTLVISIAFALFQGLMPLIGYYAGSLFSQWVSAFANWLALGLLVLVGGKMIFDGLKAKNEAPDQCPLGKGFILLVLVQALATSIDALAVGFSFAALGINIFYAIALISATTFLLSIASVLLGHKLESVLADKAQIAGGAVLILMGIKIAFF